MELVKDIYFNTDKLVENTNVKVSYTGKFYQGNNDKVYIHYGYGENWNNVNEIEMTKTDLGYQTELCLNGSDTLNFCFKNQNNEWDNNFGKNYVFNIEKATSTKLGKTTIGTKTINGSFFGKSFKSTNSNNSSNVYWTSESNNLNPTEGTFENATPATTPTSVDAIIHNSGSNTPEFEIIPNLATKFDTPVVSGCVNISGINGEIPNTSLNNNLVGGTNIFQNSEININKENLNQNPTSGFKKVEINSTPNITNTTKTIATNVAKNTVSTNIINPVKTNQENAIALAPTGFNYWTKKIKDTVCKFFAYVPKLISGNYKRNLSDDKKS